MVETEGYISVLRSVNKLAKIAVLLATYQGETYLSEQLDSLLQQTFQDFVIYIHDDGSSDGTLQVIQDYAKQYPEKIVLLTYEKAGGSAANFMSMLRYAKEPYIMFCDQDDVWLSDKIAQSYQTMKCIEEDAENHPCLVFTDLRVVDQNLQTISESFMTYTKRNPYRTAYTQLLVQNVAPGCTMMINQTLAKYMQRYTSMEAIQMHDWWAILIASAYGKVSYLANATILYRQHIQNVVGAVDRSLPARLKNCISACQKGTYISMKREGMKNLIAFAENLLQVGDLPVEKRETLEGICCFPSMSKLQRIRFCKKYDVSTYQRNWWFLCWV